jgi:hypothetical protein
MAAKTLTETTAKQTLTSAVRQNGFRQGLKQYFSDPTKVALWTPGLMHVFGTTIQPFFTWLGLKQSGVDQNQVNTLTQMEIVRSLTSHAMNLAGSVLPVVASELFNKNVDELNKMTPISGSYNINAVLGSMTVDLNRTLPSQMVQVEIGKSYIISATKGYYTPCPKCAKDSWFQNFFSYAPSQRGVGLKAYGFTTSRDSQSTCFEILYIWEFAETLQPKFYTRRE